MKIIYYDLNYTVIENREEKINVDNQYENVVISFYDIIPNHNVGRKNVIEVLR